MRALKRAQVLPLSSMGLRLLITPADREWALNAVSEASSQFKSFCAHGLQPYDYREAPEPFPEKYISGIIISRIWLRHFKKSKGINRAHSSYGLKHVAENWSGKYVCNGALIAAAAGLGIQQIPVFPDSPNTYLAISYGSWKHGFSDHYGVSNMSHVIESILSEPLV
jgi:hypothetical protein